MFAQVTNILYTFEELLFQLSLDDIYFSELVELLVVAATVVLCGGKLG